jgi:hypothetical protein
MPFCPTEVEPFLGLRTGVWFTEKMNLLFRADVGGFGFVAYNNVDSNLEALLGYKVRENIRIEAGYRGRYYVAKAAAPKESSRTVGITARCWERFLVFSNMASLGRKL